MERVRFLPRNNPGGGWWRIAIRRRESTVAPMNDGVNKLRGDIGVRAIAFLDGWRAPSALPANRDVDGRHVVPRWRRRLPCLRQFDGLDRRAGGYQFELGRWQQH